MPVFPPPSHELESRSITSFVAPDQRPPFGPKSKYITVIGSQSSTPQVLTFKIFQWIGNHNFPLINPCRLQPIYFSRCLATTSLIIDSNMFPTIDVRLAGLQFIFLSSSPFLNRGIAFTIFQTAGDILEYLKYWKMTTNASIISSATSGCWTKDDVALPLISLIVFSYQGRDFNMGSGFVRWSFRIIHVSQETHLNVSNLLKRDGCQFI